MKDIKYYQNIIKEKRKKTEFRDFLKEIWSWFPINLYKINWKLSRYPFSDRLWSLIDTKSFSTLWNNDFYNQELDLKNNFFNQIQKLYKKSYFPFLWNFWTIENSDYSDTIWYWTKNAYLTICAWEDVENILYSLYVISNCSNILNSVWITKNCNNIYFCSWIRESYNIFYSRYIFNSSGIWFSSNLVWCKECIFCDSLDNQSYCINNEKLEKKEYFKEKEEILKNKKDFFSNFLSINNKWLNVWSENCSWNFIINSRNVENWFFVNQVKNGKNLLFVWNWDIIESCYDNVSSATRAERSYWNMWCSPWFDMYCSFNSWWAGCNNIYYCSYCWDCHHCIWCIWLKNKSYYIFNKQYSKEDWEKKVCEIFEQMEVDGILGDFFPWTLNPFYFNDTIAGLIWWFTKEEIVKDEYMWRDYEIKVDIPEWVKLIKTNDLDKYEWFNSEWNWEINPEILKVVIIDEKGNYYRIVQIEYDFLIKYWLPLPRLHWLDRVKLNLT